MECDGPRLARENIEEKQLENDIFLFFLIFHDSLTY